MTARPPSVIGFSLIELLVVIAIAGLLATLAYPGYQQSLLRTRRSDGIAGLLSAQSAQEKFRGNCPFYAQSLGSADICGTNMLTSTVRAMSVSPGGYYSISIVANSASQNGYTIAATPTGSQAADTLCTSMMLTFSAANPHGLKAPAACW